MNFTWGDAGLVTCWLDQTYVLDGNEQHISAPTTFAFFSAATEGIWNVVLITLQFPCRPRPEVRGTPELLSEFQGATLPAPRRPHMPLSWVCRTRVQLRR